MKHSASKEHIILFDLDGTLIDSTEAILESFRVTYDTLGVPAPQDADVTALIGHPLDVMFARLGFPADQIDTCVRTYKEHYRRISCAKTTLLPGAREAIEAAAEIAHLGIVTTKTGRYSVELMEHLGLMHFFDVLIGREHVHHPKPHPEPIHKALEALPNVTGNTYMIGDTCLDMDAARVAGVIGIGVLCGYGTKETLEGCAEMLMEDAGEAVQEVESRK